MPEPAMLCLFSALAGAMLVWPLAVRIGARRRARDIAGNVQHWAAIEEARAINGRRHLERSKALFTAAAKLRECYGLPAAQPTEEER